MQDIRFVEVEEALRIHKRQVDRFGGDDGIRDRGLLESALTMPRASFGGAFVHEDIPAMAGAYLYHLCKNHPFVDATNASRWRWRCIFWCAMGCLWMSIARSCRRRSSRWHPGRLEKDEITAYLREALVG